MPSSGGAGGDQPVVARPVVMGVLLRRDELDLYAVFDVDPVRIPLALLDEQSVGAGGLSSPILRVRRLVPDPQRHVGAFAALEDEAAVGRRRQRQVTGAVPRVP